MASYPKAQYNSSGTELVEDGKSPVAGRLAYLNAVLATPQGPLGFWEHFSVSRNKVFFEAHPTLTLCRCVFIRGALAP